MRIHSIAIRYFDAVRKAGSIREAARHLNVASSAVNRQILKLESELGTPLFERLPRGLKLSTAGEVLTRHVAIVLRDAARAQSELDSLKGVKTGRVEVIAVESLTADFLPVVIGQLRQHHARVRVKVLIKDSTSVPAAVVNGDVDVGIAFSIPRNPELRQLAMARFRLGAVMTAAHPLAGRSRVKIADCADYPLIMSDDQLSIHHLMQPIIVRARRSIAPTIEANSIELMKNLAHRNLGISFMSRLGLEDAINKKVLVHVPLEDSGPVYTELGLYMRSNAGLPAAVDAFVQIATTEMLRLASEEQGSLVAR
ncbi:MAG TPA: LysR family transcriptional regulator [Steroidobacteraceae bacterium]|nr:LysR family transcriptional regulator [Steroidobacteraceae bacterium]